MHLGEPAERFAALASREEQRDPVRQQPPGDERERPSRGRIEPLGVVDHTQEGLIVRCFDQQTQYREPDEEWVRGASGGETERDGKRLALRIGQALAEAEDRPRELLERGVRQLRFALDAGSANDLAVPCELNREFEESGLAHAGLSVEHQPSPVPGTCVIQEALEHLSLSLSAEHLLSKQPRDHMGTLAAVRRFVAAAERQAARARTKGFPDSGGPTLGETGLNQTKEA
jgi:hypothetical protein